MKRLLITILSIIMAVASILGLTACEKESPPISQGVMVMFMIDEMPYAIIYTTEKDNVAMPPDPQKLGYEFDGWFWDEDVWENPVTQETLGEEPTANYHTVYAKFNVAKYTITYHNVEGATNPNPEIYGIDDPVCLQDAEKEGYTFDGWYYDSRYIFKLNDYNLDYRFGDINLYAKFSAINYKITYHNVEGLINLNQDKHSIETPAILMPVNKEGHTFDGWYFDSEFTNQVVDNTFSYTQGEVDLYAKFTPNEYTITFDSDGGSEVSPITAEYGAEVVRPQDPTKDGFEFLGWFIEGTNVQYIFTTMGASDVKLCAKWIKV